MLLHFSYFSLYSSQSKYCSLLFDLDRRQGHMVSFRSYNFFFAHLSRVRRVHVNFETLHQQNSLCWNGLIVQFRSSQSEVVSRGLDHPCMYPHRHSDVCHSAASTFRPYVRIDLCLILFLLLPLVVSSIGTNANHFYHQHCIR